MRIRMLVAAAGLAGAIGCSDDVRTPTAPGGTAELEFRWEGAEVCAEGVALLVVRIPQRTLVGDGTIFYPGDAVVDLTVDGVARAMDGFHRFRIDGDEAILAASLAADELEVYTALGGECDWITARRAR